MKAANLEKLRQDCHGSFKPILDSIPTGLSTEWLAYWCARLAEATLADYHDEQKFHASAARSLTKKTSE